MKKVLLSTLVVLLITSFSQAQAMPGKKDFPLAKPKAEKIVHRNFKAPHIITGQQPLPPLIVQQVPVVYGNYDSYSSDYYPQPNISFSNDKMSISIGF